MAILACLPQDKCLEVRSCYSTHEWPDQLCFKAGVLSPTSLEEQGCCKNHSLFTPETPSFLQRSSWLCGTQTQKEYQQNLQGTWAHAQPLERVPKITVIISSSLQQVYSQVTTTPKGRVYGWQVHILYVATLIKNE